jgi:hypothetical protein
MISNYKNNCCKEINMYIYVSLNTLKLKILLKDILNVFKYKNI